MKTVRARVTRRMSVPPERAYDAWLDPAKIRDWFGPGLGPMVRIDVEPRVGGRFSWVQRRGDKDVEHVGEFLELAPPRRIAFTFAVPPDPASKVIVEISPVRERAQGAGEARSAGAAPSAGARSAGAARSSGGSEVTVTHEIPIEWAAFVPRSVESWGKMLDAMAAVA